MGSDGGGALRFQRDSAQRVSITRKMTVWRMEDFAALVPDSLEDCSGKVFYSGRKAFEAPSRVYILGINPGGNPSNDGGETVGKHTDMVLSSKRDDWSAYRDEIWGSEPGSAPLQKRIKHLCREIGMDLCEVPASNLIFKRSTVFSKLQGDAKQLAEACWPFHQKVIDTLGVRVVVCLGKPASDFVREKLKAHRQICKFVENNGRRWQSHTYESLKGIQVVRLSHPSRADWTKCKTDPTGLVLRALCRLG